MPVCKTTEISSDNSAVCGESEVVWGREAKRAGLPSRLNSRGKNYSKRPIRRSRNRRSSQQMTWMQMLKEQDHNRNIYKILYIYIYNIILLVYIWITRPQSTNL